MSASHALPRGVYVTEASQHVRQARGCIPFLDGPPADAGESLEKMFRAVCTIRGGAATFGFPDIASISHVVQSLVDQIRQGGLRPTPSLKRTLGEALDSIDTLLSRSACAEVAPATTRQEPTEEVDGCDNLKQVPATEIVDVVLRPFDYDALHRVVTQLDDEGLVRLLYGPDLLPCGRVHCVLQPADPDATLRLHTRLSSVAAPCAFNADAGEPGGEPVGCNAGKGNFPLTD